jgi:hypothetical protein
MNKANAVKRVFDLLVSRIEYGSLAEPFVWGWSGVRRVLGLTVPGAVPLKLDQVFGVLPYLKARGAVVVTGHKADGE